MRRRAVVGFVLSLGVLGAFVWLLGPASVVANVVAADARWFLVGLVAVLLAVVCWSEAQRHLLAAAGVHLGGWRTFVTPRGCSPSKCCRRVTPAALQSWSTHSGARPTASTST